MTFMNKKSWDGLVKDTKDKITSYDIREENRLVVIRGNETIYSYIIFGDWLLRH